MIYFNDESIIHYLHMAEEYARKSSAEEQLEKYLAKANGDINSLTITELEFILFAFIGKICLMIGEKKASKIIEDIGGRTYDVSIFDHENNDKEDLLSVLKEIFKAYKEVR